MRNQIFCSTFAAFLKTDSIMNRKILLLPLVLCLALAVRAEVTHLKIEFLVEAEMERALSVIGKIVFDDEEMCLFDKEGIEMGCTPFAQINKILFVEEATTSVNEQSGSLIQVFPNPAQEMLVVRGVEGPQIVRIYSLNGQIAQSATAVDREAQLHVGTLQNGTYLLQIGAQVVKFIKE